MLKNSIKTLSLGAALALAATGAFAQTTNNSTVNSNQTPASVGVTPQTANEANQKAVQRSDTGTLVRTEPSAADRARDAANRVQNNANTSGTATTGSTGTGTTMDNNTNAMSTGTTGQRRAPRADRN
ncbi:hypothetical protein [Comamonas endophytica]|uniref:Uncharacterized protein n=1 Tax=Comamonas endophytica TaxID=2949090 RepID=A0ABY6GGP6_9BURK|nr:MULTISPECIES: hypothetical protein [unclassified Acidovorax]MCD2513150.1 hypothetical protein [Acidovorax sp. D4N7]UYG53500.1 hypothetical protein M9799_19220 [Acidovorax sp. 5MLIR]